ncbi:MAG: ribosomal-protein-alanine N-acetyltransferase [Firmicutes bacterium ADurb.Bin248]|nr:MAG: ribosomal-protein-alanine N-acetyltransferase [Firmicutes bacterium ADurb.Bin248]HOF99494.1 ribosomal protein S18-alanine N-acetyltransferase [Clostridia bacterium]HPK15187.1 ribosomal protein S18-alanine N-acetyltransferase [Clostridia bacterium]
MSRDLIRPMRPGDVERIAELEKLCFRTPWSRNAIAGELKNAAAHYLVCEREGTVVAYAGMWVVFDEAHITNVAVAPDCRGCGLGRRMMLCAMRAARLYGAEQMTLEVRETNLAAQSLYASLDFEAAGVRKGYYSDTGESAFILWNRDIARTLETWRPGADHSES